MKPKLQVRETEIATNIRDGIEYISITDIARYINPDRTGGYKLALDTQS